MLCLNDLGFEMRPVPTRDGSAVHQLETPFQICRDAPLEAYVQTSEGEVWFFDEGLNLHTLLSLGMSFEEEAAWGRLQDAFRGTGAVLHPSGQIEMIAPRERTEEACARYLLALTQLESLVTDKNCPMDSDRKEYVARAALALRCAFPEAEMECFPVLQTSGGEISFDLRVDGRYVDVLSVDAVHTHVGKVEALRIERPDVQTLAVVIDEADASGRAVAEKDAIEGAVPVTLLSVLETSALRPKRQQ